jgi:predicted phosphoribosyltransferase
MDVANLSRARVVIVDDVMVTGAAMKAAIESARCRGASQVVVAVLTASRPALDVVIPLVHSVHTLSLRAHLRPPGRNRSSIDGIRGD